MGKARRVGRDEIRKLAMVNPLVFSEAIGNTPVGWLLDQESQFVNHRLVVAGLRKELLKLGRGDELMKRVIDVLLPLAGEFA